ncbi:lasso peptide biosynthesis B2 protein [Lacihabitans sp. CCS-44]|uniref:lasso peptide biosynthesis B2 protein n=1 Tax=Lacihabitans sp. CCS-44 TaxID=2487331 RepID=UPI0020CFB268|nr:lasso peptide biosynthesis B2 protein [Lacihabitans sp. CCS-44]MCP9754754.1 lasso peptide biosynthesis B2 protein [Lacihabitans sp. CCS-44]
MKNWWKSFKTFWRLSRLNKVDSLKIAIYLTFFWFTLKMVPFNKFIRLYNYILRNHKSTNYNISRVQEITQTIKTVSRYLVFDSTCLTQALTAKLILRSIPDLVLTIGVSLVNGFEAHAWIEKDRMYIIGDTPSSHFTPIWCIE